MCQSLELQRHSHETLKQCVVDFTTDPRTLGKHQIELTTYASKMKLPASPHKGQHHGSKQDREQLRLVKRRCDREIQGGTGFSPISLARCSLHLKTIVARWQIRIERLSSDSSFDPVALEAIQTIAEPN